MRIRYPRTLPGLRTFNSLSCLLVLYILVIGSLVMWVALLLAYSTAVGAAGLGLRQEECSSLQLLYARGTGEALDPLGVAVGNPLFEQTKEYIPDLTGYAIDYPASLDCKSRDTGANDTVNQLTTQSAACPEQQYALAGYSQGADILHFAAQSIPESLYPRIVAIVLFGDPGNRGPEAMDPLGGKSPAFPPPLADKLRQNCAHDDMVCTLNGTVFEQHLVYANLELPWIAESAYYISRQFESGGNAGAMPAAESPGEQTEENIQALFGLSRIMGNDGIQQTCNGTDMTYIQSNFTSTMTTAVPLETGASSAGVLTTVATRLSLVSGLFVAVLFIAIG